MTPSSASAPSRAAVALRGLLVSLVGAIPLYFVLDLRDTFDLPKISLVYAVVLLGLGLSVWECLSRRTYEVTSTPLDLPLAALLAVGAISCLTSLDRSVSVWGSYRLYIFGLVPMTSFALLYRLTARYADNRLRDLVVVVAITSGALVALYSVLQYSGVEVFSRMPRIAGGRPWSSLGNSLYAGSIAMMAALLAFQEKRFWGFPGLVVSSVGVALSQSRSAWLGLIVGIFILLVLERENRKLLLKRAGLLLAAGLLALGSAPHIRRRAQTVFSVQEHSNRARLEGWKAAFQIWRENPWLGSGPDTFLYAFRRHNTLTYSRSAGSGVGQADAHNDFLQVASTMGSLGVLAYIGMLIAIWKIFIRSTENENLGLGAALVGLGVQNLFNFSSVAAMAWASVFLGLLAGRTAARRDWVLPAFVGKWIMIPIAGLLGVLFNIVVVRPLRADFWQQEGLAYVAGGRLEESRRAHREAVRLNPRVPDYLMEFANRSRDLKYYDDAWNAIERLAREHPANPDVWNNRGVAAMWMTQLAGQNRMADADASFRRAVELDPFFLEAWANRARWEHLAGHLDEEKNLWSKVMEIDENHEMARRVLGR